MSVGTNTKITSTEMSDIKTRITTLVSKSKLTSIDVSSVSTTGKISKSTIISLQDAIRSLESNFSNNCCESNHCQTCQSSKCQGCQTCQSSKCQSSKCQSCQSQCHCRCNCCGNDSSE